MALFLKKHFLLFFLFLFLYLMMSCNSQTSPNTIQQNTDTLSQTTELPTKDTEIDTTKNIKKDTKKQVTEENVKKDTNTCDGLSWQEVLDAKNWKQKLESEFFKVNVKKIYNLFKQKNKTIEANKYLKKQLHLPQTTILYEYAPLTKAGFANRAIAVLLPNPCVNLESPGSCITQTGYAKISQDVKFVLIDTEKNKIINQLDLEEDFEMPIITENEQLINMLDFKDYAHDGKACEFYVLSYMGCGNTDYQFIGYNPHTDKIQVIKYKIKITEQKYDAKTESYLPTDTSYTTEFNALSNVPLDKMVKKQTLRYSYYYGHGDDLTNFMDIKFDAKKFCFTGTLLRKLDNKEMKGWTGY